LLAGLVISLFGQVTTRSIGSKYATYGSTIEVLANGSRSEIAYKSFEYMLADLKDKTDGEITKLPPGGCILVNISDETIKSANTKQWKYIVQSLDGKEILRQQGTDYIPNYLDHFWQNINVIFLKETQQTNFKIYIINTFSNNKSAFAVYPNQNQTAIDSLDLLYNAALNSLKVLSQ